MFGNSVEIPGRTIREGDYKIIIFDDPEITTDTPIFELYNVVSDPDEQMELLGQTGGLSAEQQEAYDSLLARNEALGGGFGDVPVVDNSVTLYFELQNPNAQGAIVPPLINATNGNIIQPQAITVGGVSATWEVGVNANGSAACRVDTTETADQLWIKFGFDPIAVGFDQTDMEGPHEVAVTFPGGGARTYTAINSYTYSP